MGECFLVFPKVGLSDIFFVRRSNKSLAAFNKITSKHVDFLICDPGGLNPVFGIELDDSSHESSKRMARDDFVDELFDTAGLPLIRVPVKVSYDTRELGALFREALRQFGDFRAPEPPSAEEVQHTLADPPAQASAPLCPKCGIPMIIRTAKRGSHEGERFFGCSNYPRCKNTMPCDRHEATPA